MRAMTGLSAGHGQALGELEEIQSLVAGDPPAFRVEGTEQADEARLLVEVSLSCADVPVSPDGVPLGAREHAVLLIPAYYPFSQPIVRVLHGRFAGLPYVLGGKQICLYHSESDWNPADGMFGLIGRLAAWYRRAAAGRLVEVGQPLHPPLAYQMFGEADCVVIRPDLPRDFEPSSAIMVRRYRGRVDLVKWLRPAALNLDNQVDLRRVKSELSDATRTHGGLAFLGAVMILREPLSFEFPDNLEDLVAALAAQQVDQSELLGPLKRAWGANMLAVARTDTPLPLFLVLGAPMRGFAGADVQDTHLEVWQCDVTDAVIRPIRALTHGGDSQLAEWFSTEQRLALEWIRRAPLAWAFVTEARRQIVTRRDNGRPAQWLLGKTVLVLGCGALGARIAEHCVRAGVNRLIVADSGAVSPGILVRQPYQDDDIGLAKARRLAERLIRIRPSADIQIVENVGDVRRTIFGDDSYRPQSDLIVDATANRGVSAHIEWLRRARPGRWPPILTVGVGHTCERAVGALAFPHASGAGTDILQSFADQAMADETLTDAIEDFFADPDPGSIFQPEIGCSEPTFTGSDPEAAAAAGLIFTWSLRLLSDHAAHRPVAPKSLFLARMPGDRQRSAHVYLEWPNDVISEDGQSGYQLRIRPEAMKQMHAEALMTARLFPGSCETGGILLGYFDDACRVAWVTAAEGPPPDSMRDEHAFLHGTDGVEGCVERHEVNSGGRIGFIGMWHTHPSMSASATQVDDRAMGSLLAQLAAGQVPRRAIQLVLGGEDERWSWWLQGSGQPDIGFRLFKRNQISVPSGTAEPPEQEN